MKDLELALLPLPEKEEKKEDASPPPSPSALIAPFPAFMMVLYLFTFTFLGHQHEGVTLTLADQNVTAPLKDFYFWIWWPQCTVWMLMIFSYDLQGGAHAKLLPRLATAISLTCAEQFLAITLNHPQSSIVPLFESNFLLALLSFISADTFEKLFQSVEKNEDEETKQKHNLRVRALMITQTMCATLKCVLTVKWYYEMRPKEFSDWQVVYTVCVWNFQLSGVFYYIMVGGAYDNRERPGACSLKMARFAAALSDSFWTYAFILSVVSARLLPT